MKTLFCFIFCLQAVLSVQGAFDSGPSYPNNDSIPVLVLENPFTSKMRFFHEGALIQFQLKEDTSEALRKGKILAIIPENQTILLERPFRADSLYQLAAFSYLQGKATKGKYVKGAILAQDARVISLIVLGGVVAGLILANRGSGSSGGSVSGFSFDFGRGSSVIGILLFGLLGILVLGVFILGDLIILLRGGSLRNKAFDLADGWLAHIITIREKGKGMRKS